MIFDVILKIIRIKQCIEVYRFRAFLKYFTIVSLFSIIVLAVT